MMTPKERQRSEGASLRPRREKPLENQQATQSDTENAQQIEMRRRNERAGFLRKKNRLRSLKKG
jgi:hypothetical protein